MQSRLVQVSLGMLIPVALGVLAMEFSASRGWNKNAAGDAKDALVVTSNTAKTRNKAVFEQMGVSQVFDKKRNDQQR